MALVSETNSPGARTVEMGLAYRQPVGLNGTDEDPPGAVVRQMVERQVWIAGLHQLADELYELRCEIGLASYGERGYTETRLSGMRTRVQELEPVVGEYLEWLLQQEDAEDAAEPEVDVPEGGMPDLTFEDPERGRTALSDAIYEIAGRSEAVGAVLAALPIARMSSIWLVAWWALENEWLDGRRPIDVIATDPQAVRDAAARLADRT